MLTSEQSIVEFSDGRATPDRLTQAAHRHYIEYGEKMLALYAQGAGRQRCWLHRQVESLFADEPDCPVRRIQAFCKLLDDRSVFEGDRDGKAAKLRLEVFSKAAKSFPLVERADRLFESDEKQVKTRLAGEMGMSWDQIEQGLYADVMAYQELRRFDGYPDPTALLSRYNVAQLQACLYRAEDLTILATGDFKTIVRYAKLARLLHEIERVGQSKYRFVFSGPVSVLDQTRRYGVNLARFLPALLACTGWTMTAVIQTPWNGRARLELSDRDGFSSHLPQPEEFDSDLEQALAEKFGPARDGWQLIREGEVLYDSQTVFIPDFLFRHADGTEVLLEIVGFWTPEYLAHKRQTLQRFQRHNILIAVPQSSLKDGASIGDRTLVYKTTIKLKCLMDLLERFRGRTA